MNSTARAFYGALCGAILTITVHPVSRPFITSAFSRKPHIIGVSAFPDPLPVPQDSLTASAWVHVAAERLTQPDRINQDQIRAVCRLTERFGKLESQNAFWPMAESVFQSKLGEQAAAVEAWSRASKCITYDDFQTKSLIWLAERIANGSGPKGWQYALVYRMRSFALAKQIEAYARNLVTKLDRASPADLQLRLATLRNGDLLRDSSRNLEIMESGVSVVEIASHPKELRNETSVRRLLLAHFEFKEALRKLGMEAEAQNIERSYNENDGWSALTKREDPQKLASNLTLLSSVWPSLPGVFLICALPALLLFAVAQLYRAKVKDFSVGPIFAFGGVLCLAIWFASHSWLALAAVALSCAFTSITPKRIRQRPPDDLGPLLWVAVLFLSVAILVFCAVAQLCNTAPFSANLPAFDSQIAVLADPGLAVAFAILALAALFVLSPLWALVQHVPTGHVYSRAASMTGATIATAALVCTVVATPISIAMQAQASETMKMLVENEPLYYVRQ